MSVVIDPKKNPDSEEIRKIKAFLVITNKYFTILSNIKSSKLPDYEGILQQYIPDNGVRDTLSKELNGIKASIDEIHKSEAYNNLLAHIKRMSEEPLLTASELATLAKSTKDNFDMFSAKFSEINSKLDTATSNIRAKVSEFQPPIQKKPQVVQTAASASAAHPAAPDRMPDPSWLKDRSQVDKMRQRLVAQGKKEMLEMLDTNLFNWDYSKSDETREKAKNNLYYLARLPGVGWMEPDFDYSVITEDQFRAKIAKAIKTLKESGLEGIDDIAQPIIEQYSLFLGQFVENGMDKKVPGKVPPESISPMPAFCIDGPPGTGKTSVSQAIAKALDIGYFYEPMASKSEKEIIFGHGSSWVSPDPGLISRAMIETGRTDYLLLADEVEKAELSLLNTLGEILEVNQRTYKDDFFKSGINKGHPLIVLTTNDFTKLPEFVQSRVTKLYMGGYPDEIKIKILKGSLLSVRTPSSVKFKTADKSDLKDINRNEYDLFTIELSKKPSIADLTPFENAKQVPLLIKYKEDGDKEKFLIYGTNKDLTEIPDRDSKPFISVKFQKNTLTSLESHAVVPGVYKTLKSVRGFNAPIIPADRVFSYEDANKPSDDVVRFLVENYVVVPGVREAKALLQTLVATAAFESLSKGVKPFTVTIDFVKEKFGKSPVKDIKELEKKITSSNQELSKLRNEILDLVSLQENLGDLDKLDAAQMAALKEKVAQYGEKKKELILLESGIQKALRESKPSQLEPINKQVDILRENHKGAIDKIKAMDLELINKANVILGKEQLKAESSQQKAAVVPDTKPVSPASVTSVTFRQLDVTADPSLTAAKPIDLSQPSTAQSDALRAVQNAQTQMRRSTATATPTDTQMTPSAVSQRSSHPSLSVTAPVTTARSMIHSPATSMPTISVEASPSPRKSSDAKPIPEIAGAAGSVLEYLQKGAASIREPKSPLPPLAFNQHSWDTLLRTTAGKYSARATQGDEVVREVFNDWHVDLPPAASKPSSVELKRGDQAIATIERDPKTGEVVKTVKITSNDPTPAPDAVLQMVVNACLAAREAGKDFITISGCQDSPKTAILMENLIALAGFTPKYSTNDNTKAEVDKIRQGADPYKLETDPQLEQPWATYKASLQNEIARRSSLDHS